MSIHIVNRTICLILCALVSSKFIDNWMKSQVSKIVIAILAELSIAQNGDLWCLRFQSVLNEFSWNQSAWFATNASIDHENGHSCARQLNEKSLIRWWPFWHGQKKLNLKSTIFQSIDVFMIRWNYKHDFWHVR